MKKNVPIRESREWKMALDNLEQMHPRFLMDQLRSGSLGKLLQARVERYFRTLMDLQQRMPNEPIENLQEMAQEQLVPVNPNWQDEEPLSAEERSLVKRYLAQNQSEI